MAPPSLNHLVKVSVTGPGLYDVTHKVTEKVTGSGVATGLCTVFIRHTSASLLISENADPSVQDDLKNFLDRLVPEGAGLYSHTAEGADDMPAHIKSVLTAVSLGIPVDGGRLLLGTWQGIYLWEHRRHRGVRELIVNVLGT